MGVYTKAMEMPTSCYKCGLKQRYGMDIVCLVLHECFSVADVNILDYRLDNCPLIPVPPHGRLIDADALKQNTYEIYDPMGIIEAVPVDVIDNAPTVIEAEEGEA